MIYKLAVQGIDIIQVEANNEREAERIFWDEELNTLHSSDILEVVGINQNFKQHTDLN